MRGEETVSCPKRNQSPAARGLRTAGAQVQVKGLGLGPSPGCSGSGTAVITAAATAYCRMV